MPFARATLLALAAFLSSAQLLANDQVVAPSVIDRYRAADVTEEPDFQKHVVPLFSRLGCNGRACHGSFQGRGGFRLSLFGYDFKADHAALADSEHPRVIAHKPDESLILTKPTSDDMHEGGKRYELGSWQHHLLRRWVESGAKLGKSALKLARLEVTPHELILSRESEQASLHAVAVWEDGAREDVTPLCRFQTNDDDVARIDASGTVTAGRLGDTHVVVFYDNAVVPVPVLRPVSDLLGDRYPLVATPTRIDQLVVQKLRRLGIVPSELSSETEFLRRVRLDMTGTLPSPVEVEQFLADQREDKRARKIDELLETPEYAAWWTTRLCDFTGNNEDQLVNLVPARGSASKQWYDWIHQRVAANVPYDQLVEGIVTATSRQGDESYRQFCDRMSQICRDSETSSYADTPSLTYYWARRQLNNPENRAIAFAYAFLGARIQCAQCHKHPFDEWSKDEFDQFKAFFSRVQTAANGLGPEARQEYQAILTEAGIEGVKGNDLRKKLPDALKEGKTIPFPEVAVVKGGGGNGRDKDNKNRKKQGNRRPAATAKLLGGAVIELDDQPDPRQTLMTWLRDPGNRFFARAFVNRVWATYFNVGIVEPPDDNSLANAPSNRELLDYLSQGFVEHGFDMKWLHREIANSRTYQLSWRPTDSNRHDTKNFSHSIPRRLPAEVAYDAVRQASSSDEQLVAMQGNVTGRAIAIPGVGYKNNNRNEAAYALRVFGRSTRDTNCDCDRSTDPSLLQTVYMQNDRDVLQMVGIRKDGWVEQVAKKVNPNARPDGNQNERKVGNIRKQIDNIERQLKKADQPKENPKVRKLRGQLDSLRKQLAKLTPTQDSSTQRTDLSKPDSERLIHQAYLRTLSRPPSATELARCQLHVSDAEDTVQGFRDVLWALLNTKEFIVNH